MNKFFTAGILAFLIFSCKNNENQFDATGAFEAEETIVSAEQTGKILELAIEEGQELAPQTPIGQIDVSALEIQKAQSEASLQAIREKTADASPQINILQSQMATQKSQIATLNQQLVVLNKEVNRTQNLVNANAVPQKQLDDLEGQRSILQKQIATAQEQLGVLNAQIASAKASIRIQNSAVLSELKPSQKRIDVIEDQIRRGKIINPYAGTVITKYAQKGEFATIGKPLYKIANLSNMILRVYLTGNQLPQVKLNQAVKVLTDDGKGGFRETTGKIIWISSKAEFTPKTIQTKDERANLVYAAKVLVKNDGTYKMGMYGEIKFQ